MKLDRKQKRMEIRRRLCYQAGYPTAEYDLWMYDEEADNVATREESNFVWVEIAYVMEELTEESIDFHPTITFQFSSA